jgi:GAF domain-containing protein
MIEAEHLAEVFVEVADTLVDDFDLIEFLQMLTTRSSAIVELSAAGLLLADQKGRLHVMAASDEQSKLLELFQVQAEEGPCQDCFRQGAPVVNADLTQANARWPQFAPQAVASGYRSVHAFPLRLRDQMIGALNLFGTDAGRLEPAEIRVIQALADVATIALLQERTIHRSEILSQQLQAALQSRIVIEQAKGALAQIHSCDLDQAFEMLRSYSRSHNRKLGEVARSVTAAPSSVAELTTPHGAK